MTSYVADQTDFIAKRLKEIEKEKQERVTGEKIPEVGEVAIGWPMYAAADYDPA